MPASLQPAELQDGDVVGLKVDNADRVVVGVGYVDAAERLAETAGLIEGRLGDRTVGVAALAGSRPARDRTGTDAAELDLVVVRVGYVEHVVVEEHGQRVLQQYGVSRAVLVPEGEEVGADDRLDAAAAPGIDRAHCAGLTVSDVQAGAIARDAARLRQ